MPGERETARTEAEALAISRARPCSGRSPWRTGSRAARSSWSTRTSSSRPGPLDDGRAPGDGGHHAARPGARRREQSDAGRPRSALPGRLRGHRVRSGRAARGRPSEAEQQLRRGYATLEEMGSERPLDDRRGARRDPPRSGQARRSALLRRRERAGALPDDLQTSCPPGESAPALALQGRIAEAESLAPETVAWPGRPTGSTSAPMRRSRSPTSCGWPGRAGVGRRVEAAPALYERKGNEVSARQARTLLRETLATA